MKELKAHPVVVQIGNCNDTWIQHVSSMDRICLHTGRYEISTGRKKKTGRPIQGPRDGVVG